MRVATARAAVHAAALGRRPVPNMPPAPAPAVPAAQRRWCSEMAKDVDIDSVAYGFMASQAMFSALSLGLFDAVAAREAGATIADLQGDLGIQAPRLQTLLTALTAHHMLRRSPAGTYTLSPNTAKFLVKSSRFFYGDYIRLQVGGQFYARMGGLGGIMQNGGGDTYEAWFADPEEATTYTMAQHNGSLATARQLIKAYDLSNVEQLIDVGGGSGAFSITMARKYPSLQSTILELPEVAATGRKVIAKEDPQVAERITYKSGTALTDWPVADAAADCVLMSYLSGSVPAHLLQPLYARAYQSLRPGGRLVVHDFMVNDTLDGPPLAALWALQHVAVNADGLGLSPANVTDAMRAGGFEDVANADDLIGGMTKVVVATKRAA